MTSGRHFASGDSLKSQDAADSRKRPSRYTLAAGLYSSNGCFVNASYFGEALPGVPAGDATVGYTLSLRRRCGKRVVTKKRDNRRVESHCDRPATYLPVSQIPGTCPKPLGGDLLLESKIEPPLQDVAADVV
jgi:hypothetical protein